MKAWIAISSCFGGRYGLTLERRRSWKKLVLTTELMCVLNLKVLSKVTPRFLADERILEMRLSGVLYCGARCWSKIIISVLFWLRFRKFASIQAFMSVKQSSSGWNELELGMRGM